MRDFIPDKLHEECAVFGVSLNVDGAKYNVRNGLVALQHRGHESAGFAYAKNGDIKCFNKTGLVGELFSSRKIKRMPESGTAVGHTRYSTTGTSVLENAGPFLAGWAKGRIVVAHNGNITNAEPLKAELKMHGVPFEATSDSEVIAALMAHHAIKEKDTVAGVVKAAGLLQGAYSLVIATGGGRLIAIRDANGYRPLCLGKNETGFAVASESCALDSTEFEFVRDVLPGEMVVMQNGEITQEGTVLQEKNDGGLCIFEYVYFARPDSVIDGVDVYQARMNMGAELARKSTIAADIVSGVPNSGISAAIGYSKESRIPYEESFFKNHYAGRSFINPTQDQRSMAVKLKLNPVKVNVNGKSIVLMDDSIVRGTTSKKIITSLRQAGAKEVHFRVSSPPFRYTCYYGTDIGDASKNLIAHKMSVEKIRREIGADTLEYMTIEELLNACRGCQRRLCTKCFTGHDSH
ncbi:MAG: amidophosphoribosyltransferase [Rickettsiales bacterium]|jgi:amidophosphoribosyltransferase|nr:amidophosphoribosyltransferase [Rickettsiales bacterium]